MATKHLRIMLAHWLRRRSEAEERFWAKEGEERLKTFDQGTAVSHEDAWN